MPSFKMTEQARNYLSEMVEDPSREKVFRITIDKFMCAGFSFTLVPGEKLSTDVTFEVDGFVLVVDPKFIPFLGDSVVSMNAGRINVT